MARHEADDGVTKGAGEPGRGKGGGAPGGSGGHVFQAPTGTRDFYPAELNRLRYVQDAWRRTSINHGFEEIDGPTFEHLDLYTVKSGEGIVSELFSFERFGGEKTFALRPEFTPTLARMYASKAASLPKPTKWFWMQNCYRAERPQRGRLREFSQWNCDIIGDDSAQADAECIACCVGVLETLGLRPGDIKVQISHRRVWSSLLERFGVDRGSHQDIFRVLDRTATWEQTMASLGDLGLDENLRARIGQLHQTWTSPGATWRDVRHQILKKDEVNHAGDEAILEPLWELHDQLVEFGLNDWCALNMGIVRGLAYYTGMVFEVVAGGERAIAGGGRYDKLIEMFGGPPTPAVGFGMGDVVLSLVLADKGLLPKDEDVAARLGLNPDALVISNGTPEADGAVAGVVAELRRAGLHARRSYKTTKNIGKLIQDAAKMRARYCVILESAESATVKDMGTQGQEGCGVAELAGRIARR